MKSFALEMEALVFTEYPYGIKLMKRHNRDKKSCRKVQYRTREVARKALKELRKSGHRSLYKCPFCKGGVYHLTSEPK